MIVQLSLDKAAIDETILIMIINNRLLIFLLSLSSVCKGSMLMLNPWCITIYIAKYNFQLSEQFHDQLSEQF